MSNEHFKYVVNINIWSSKYVNVYLNNYGLKKILIQSNLLSFTNVCMLRDFPGYFSFQQSKTKISVIRSPSSIASGHHLRNILRFITNGVRIMERDSISCTFMESIQPDIFLKDSNNCLSGPCDAPGDKIGWK